MKNVDLALGLVGGAAIGALVGVLFAPEKGENTRKKLLDHAKSMMTKGENVESSLSAEFENFASNIASKYNLTKAEIEKIWSETKFSFLEAKSEIAND